MKTSEWIEQVTGELKGALEKVSGEEVDRLVAAVAQAKRVFVVGAGRSGLMMKAFAMRLMHLGVSTFVVGETTTPAIASGDLLMAGSGSGRTAGVVAVAKRAKAKGARLAVVTAAPESPLGALAELTVRIYAPTPKAVEKAPAESSVQPMGTLFEQSLLVLLDVVILALMERAGKDSDTMFAQHSDLE
jgi:6-phospho-3-hexuloisomerase